MALRQLPEDLQPIASLSMGKKVMARQGDQGDQIIMIFAS
jgi:hypothetical protein